MQRTFLFSLAFCTLFCLALTGCGGEKLQGFSGTVTLDGQPLEKGSISFTPDASKGNTSGTSTIAPIKNGRYELPADQGISGGWYEVRVEATEWVEGEGEGAEGFNRNLIEPYITSHEFKPDDKTFDVDIPASR